MGNGAGLVIRGTQRHELSLPARWRVGEEHASLVRLGAGSGERDGWVDADILDISSGGLGLISELFVPRGTVMRAEVFRLNGQESPPVLEIDVIVRRVIMTDRRPAYLFGTSFHAPSDDQATQLQELMRALDGE